MSNCGPPYRRGSGNVCGCNCGCCPPPSCPSVQIIWKILMSSSSSSSQMCEKATCMRFVESLACAGQNRLRVTEKWVKIVNGEFIICDTRELCESSSSSSSSSSSGSSGGPDAPFLSNEITIDSNMFKVIPTGTIIDFAGENTPDGWLLCEGQELSRENHNELFLIIGTSYGAGDGTTTFNIPNCKSERIKPDKEYIIFNTYIKI